MSPTKPLLKTIFLILSIALFHNYTKLSISFWKLALCDHSVMFVRPASEQSTISEVLLGMFDKCFTRKWKTMWIIETPVSKSRNSQPLPASFVNVRIYFQKESISTNSSVKIFWKNLFFFLSSFLILFFATFNLELPSLCPYDAFLN